MPLESLDVGFGIACICRLLLVALLHLEILNGGKSNAQVLRVWVAETLGGVGHGSSRNACLSDVDMDRDALKAVQVKLESVLTALTVEFGHIAEL